MLPVGIFPFCAAPVNRLRRIRALDWYGEKRSLRAGCEVREIQTAADALGATRAGRGSMWLLRVQS